MYVRSTYIELAQYIVFLTCMYVCMYVLSACPTTYDVGV